MKTTNIKCRELVQARVPFEGNNLYAVNWKGAYIVYSYGEHFPIYVWKNDVWYANSDKYSVTTTKHKRLARPVPESNMMWLSTNELKTLIGI